jgi:hypothetical protein
MILRKLARSLKKQDWVTVLIEFGIVILGIYVAFAVERWREDRVQQANNSLFLQLLTDELAHKIESQRSSVEFNQEIISLQREAVRWLSGYPNATEPDQEHCRAIFRSLVLGYVAQRLETPEVLSSIEQSSDAQDLLLRQLMIRLSALQTRNEVQYERFLAQIQNISDLYPELITRRDGFDGVVVPSNGLQCDFISMRDNQSFKNRLFGNVGRYDSLQTARERELELLVEVQARVEAINDAN